MTAIPIISPTAISTLTFPVKAAWCLSQTCKDTAINSSKIFIVNMPLQNGTINKTSKSSLKKITSCYHEIWECPVSQSCFVICINISLEDLINWHENKEDVHIPKDIICTGLYNYWSGGGSPLEITLEKNIVIPKEKIAYLLPDEAWHTSQHQGILFGYSIQNCYGLEYDEWLPLNKL